MIDSAFRQGCISDNKQIDETLRYLLYPLVDIDQLSPDGHNLIQDGRDIEIAQLMAYERNVNVPQAKKDQSDVLSVDQRLEQGDG